MLSITIRTTPSLDKKFLYFSYSSTIMYLDLVDKFVVLILFNENKKIVMN